MYRCEKCRVELIPPHYMRKHPQRAKHCDKCKAEINYERVKKLSEEVSAECKKRGITLAEYWAMKRARRKGKKYVKLINVSKYHANTWPTYEEALRVYFYLYDKLNEYRKLKRMGEVR